MGEPVLKEGYLMKAPDNIKHLLNFKKWQRRWCRLNTSGDLYIYESEKASKPTGVIHFLQCNRLFDAKTRGIQTSFCCGVDVSGMTFYLKAESAKSFREWLKPMSEFADVCEINLDTVEERRGTISDGERRGTFFSERDRAESTQSTHFGFTTSGKFLSKEGWLAKTGSNNKGWKDRYFKLQNGKLFYYKSDRGDSSLGDIDLFKCTSIENATGKKGHGIDLHLPGRLYNLSAETAEERDAWVSVLSHTLALVRDIQDSPAVPRTASNASSNASHSSRERHLVDSGDSGGGSVAEEYIVVDDTGDSVGGGGVRGVEVSEHFPGNKEPVRPPAPAPSAREEGKDSVVQLLEAEVEALRGQVASLQADVKANSTLNSQLRQQLSDMHHTHQSRERELGEERDHLQTQVSRLERFKQELETINDSVTIQLEEQLVKVQELEEDLLLTRQDLEESQAANTGVEEELNDTQHRLQEIEQVAHQLEEALRKRESEPATPLSTSFKGLSLQPHTDTESEPKVGVSTTEKGVSTVEKAALKLEDVSQQVSVEKLREEISQLTRDKAELLGLVESLQSRPGEGGEGAKDLEEERLKWQMEMETLRRELSAGFSAEREVWGREKRALDSDVGVLRERVVSLESQDKVKRLEEQLTQSQSRVSELEGEVESGREKLAQLQAQKDKAMTDLIVLRKTNRSMEKRMSESEDSRVASPMSSLTLASTRPDTPDTSGKVAELEKRVEELDTALTEVQRERDALQARVDRLTSGLQSTPDFGFKLKSRASVAGSNISTAAVTPPTSSSTHSSQTDVTNQDTPPPKPKRPPRELMSKLSQNEPRSDPTLETRIRTRTASFLKSIKTMVM